MLIIDMPMPRGCAECHLKTFGGACRIPVFGNGVNYKPFEERPDWCPIKGVLPDEHGDLIDRDVAFDYINRLICGGCNAETEADCEACIKKGIDEVLYFIKPTIAAERKDDEQIH